MTEPTITAISTSVGPGAIAIIRLSGPAAHDLARRLFRPRKGAFLAITHLMQLGHIVEPETGRVLDEALCAVMFGPHTYTGEDMAEIHTHGGQVVAGRVLDLLMDQGATLAEPGEFTRRAYMNGRMDLTEAEAVAELIGARSQAEAELAAAQLAGGLKERVEALTRPLVTILAHLEVALDFPDEDAEIIDCQAASRAVREEVLGPLDELLQAYDSGRVLREGIKAAIVGRPNVGKSSLLNALLKTDKAIVTALPGTTRDVIEAEAVLDGLPVTLVDTAGLESPAADEAEAEGQRRAVARLKVADLVLVVLDRNRPLTEEDRRIVASAPADRVILVANKADLESGWKPDEASTLADTAGVVEISAKTGQGLDLLRRMIFEKLTGGCLAPGSVPELVPNMRHKRALEQARPVLERVLDGLLHGLAPELLALEINTVLDELGRIVGRTTPEDVLDEIFSQFCLGK